MDEFDFDRTALLRKLNFSGRNLGCMQMSTDTAAICTKLIARDGMEFESLKFVDRPEIEVSPGEFIIMNFRYIADASGRPQMADGVLDLIKSEELDLNFLE